MVNILLFVSDFFRVDEGTGVIYTDNPLRGAAGVYNLTLGVRDQGDGTSLTNTAVATITVLQANNGPPLWVDPLYNNHTINVLEVTMMTEHGDLWGGGVVLFFEYGPCRYASTCIRVELSWP